MKTPFLKGLATGLLLQVAIGPVFILLAVITLQAGPANGLSAVAAVTIVDYLYIALALAGIGALLRKEKSRNILGMAGAIVLTLFGVHLLATATGAEAGIAIMDRARSVYESFAAAFILTLSSPLTIVFWAGVFAARTAECSFTGRERLLFGLSAGLATPLFLGASVTLIGCLKTAIPLSLVRYANGLAGLVLMVYGITRGITTLRTGIRAGRPGPGAG